VKPQTRQNVAATTPAKCDNYAPDSLPVKSGLAQRKMQNRLNY